MCLPWTQIGFPAINIPSKEKMKKVCQWGYNSIGKWNTDESLLAGQKRLKRL
jgi:hypothetical protein